VLEDRAADGSLVARYVHGPNVDEILCKTTAGGTVYYHEDRLGSIVALTNASGAVVERYAYTGFGQSEIRNATGALLAESGHGNRFRYTGREWVPVLGLYDYRNRYYSVSLARFLGADPIGFGASDANLYRYVKNNPSDRTDPYGLFLTGCTRTDPCPALRSAYKTKCDTFKASAKVTIGLTDRIEAIRKEVSEGKMTREEARVLILPLMNQYRAAIEVSTRDLIEVGKAAIDLDRAKCDYESCDPRAL